MDIKEIMKLQYNFDSKHNWSLMENNSRNLLAIINKDLIGLYGELGEFSNIIKKLNIHHDASLLDFEEKFQKLRPDVEEEIIDTFIYLIRIATHLDIDITEQYLAKLNKNKERFRIYESKDNKQK